MKINLEYATQVRAREDVVTLPTDPVVEFSSGTYRLDELVVIARNGNKEIRKKTKDGKVDISELLFAGEIEMSVHLIKRGMAVKKWEIIPILLWEIDNTYAAFDVIRDLQFRVKALEQKTTLIV
jgi:hypothetical protein